MIKKDCRDGAGARGDRSRGSGAPARRILVLAGTAEGRKIAAFIRRRGAEEEVDFSVATAYGEELLRDAGAVNVLDGRLDEAGMEALIAARRYRLLVDATHPYADIVTANAKAAAGRTGIRYLRLLRADTDIAGGSNIRCAADTAEAAKILDRMEGRVLLATGSKELADFAGTAGFPERFVVRVLPSRESLEACEAVGLPRRNIVCMQGPFTAEMNLATLRQYGCRIMVTKSSGRPGGFEEKLRCAGEGYELLIIKRPLTETGKSLQEVLKIMADVLGGKG